MSAAAAGSAGCRGLPAAIIAARHNPIPAAVCPLGKNPSPSARRASPPAGSSTGSTAFIAVAPSHYGATRHDGCRDAQGTAVAPRGDDREHGRADRDREGVGREPEQHRELAEGAVELQLDDRRVEVAPSPLATITP